MGNWLVLGMLTGAIFSLALFVSPVPMTGPDADRASIPPGIYRMGGQVVRNSCDAQFAPWPDEWEITEKALIVGGRKFPARTMRSAVVYELQQDDPARCISGVWTVKLARQGEGIRGDANWELRPLDAAGVACARSFTPCSINAEVEGLPSGSEPAYD